MSFVASDALYFLVQTQLWFYFV